MGTLSDPGLSTELQEFYLINKHWHSDILFLEDEMRFFKLVFDRAISASVKSDRFKRARHISGLLYKLEERSNQLKAKLISHREIVKFMLEVEKEEIGVEMYNENTLILCQIKELFISYKFIKNELFKLVEEIMREEKASHLLEA